MPHWAKSDCDDMYSSTQSGILGTGSDIICLDAVDKLCTVRRVIGGTVTDRGNVAVYAKEDAYQRELMKCGDERGLSTWYDKDAMWKKFKEETFLVNDSEKWNSIIVVPGTNVNPVSSVGGVNREQTFSFGLLDAGAYCSVQAITAGSEIYRKIILDMEKMDRLPDIMGVDPRISLIVRVPLILGKDQVCLKTAKKKGIPYELSDSHVILHLKGLLDSGASDNLLSEDNLGKVITDRGNKALVYSILQEDKKIIAREVNAHFRTGTAKLLIVNEVQNLLMTLF